MKKFVQTYNIVTYGCAMNRSDSERITTVLEKAGYKKARHNRPPDLLVFNACSVRQSAVDRIYGQMGKFTSLRKRNPKFRAAVTGCILPKDRKKLL
ncbi:tRNA (N6-isopentenyl adenosine(37)-C2)-methylthiotransferase MiaB, partial [Patescibacteria group bacterium]|nr:tRNA (N6-isopentenyl adenosine(37)-C2)-methylthiotransferase MiaB [Patescibacteria group bacterium]